LLTFAAMAQEKIIIADTMRLHLSACKSSGLTVEQYCRQNQLKPSYYYYWRKKLQPSEPGRFVSIAASTGSPVVSIIFTTGLRLCFETLPPVDYLKQLLG
jgi:hypothetical protein